MKKIKAVFQLSFQKFESPTCKYCYPYKNLPSTKFDRDILDYSKKLKKPEEESKNKKLEETKLKKNLTQAHQ